MCVCFIFVWALAEAIRKDAWWFLVLCLCVLVSGVMRGICWSSSYWPLEFSVVLSVVGGGGSTASLLVTVVVVDNARPYPYLPPVLHFLRTMSVHPTTRPAGRGSPSASCSQRDEKRGASERLLILSSGLYDG